MTQEAGPDPLDVDALMADLRRRVAEKKAKGLYGVDALVAEALDDPGEPFALEELERLRELAVQRVDIDVAVSTKPVVGGVVTRVKRLLVRGTSQPVYGLSAQQTAFNAALLSYLSALGREVGAVSRRLEEERERAAELRESVDRLTSELHRAEAGLQQRIRLLEQASRDSDAPVAAGTLRLRLEAAEDSPERRAVLEGYAKVLAGEGRRVVHVGAGSGQALHLLGENAEGIEQDASLAAAGAAAGRRVRSADPVAYLSAVAPSSIDGILVSDVIERLDGEGLVALCTAMAQALAPDGAAIVEGRDPARADDIWRDPDLLRPVHPDTVRMALETAGLTVRATHGGGAGPGRYAVHAAR